MNEHFNKLSPAEAERLAMLIEECGEVIQAATKILRHGYGSYHPDSSHADNHDKLIFEIEDFYAIVDGMIGAGDLPYLSKDNEVTWKKKLRWTHHQKGTPNVE